MAEQVDLDELEALEKAATPGPWYHMQPGEPCLFKNSDYETYDWLSDNPIAGLHRKVILHRGACYGGTADYALIAKLRNSLTGLIAEIKALRLITKVTPDIDEDYEAMAADIGYFGENAVIKGEIRCQ